MSRGLVAAEAACAFGAAAVIPLLATRIKVDPLDRLGQVAGTAAIELRYVLFALPLVAALVIAARWREGVRFDTVARLACATVAGLFSGIVAAGVVVALRGTRFGLGGAIGDAYNLSVAVEKLRQGTEPNPVYPPLFMHMLAWYADLLGTSAFYALKHLQIAMTAMLGPCTYLAWRLLLRPSWALGIGITASLPLVESAPYKPYGTIVLLVFIPLAIRFLQLVRHAGKRPPLVLARLGVIFGVAFGICCILYSGWFKWSAPGLLVAFAVVFPWRTAWREALCLCVPAAIVFAAIAGPYLYGAFTNLDWNTDNFIYLDAKIDPTYIGMWGGDVPANTIWPPRGELGGVGVYSLLMFAGFGAAIALGRARTKIIALGSIVGGAWLLRFWYAHLMFKTKLVQLYPRTTHELVYCLLLMCGLAAMFYAEKRERTRSMLIGSVCALLVLFGSAGSAICDRYMPNKDVPMSFGILAWNAHHSRL